MNLVWIASFPIFGGGFDSHRPLQNFLRHSAQRRLGAPLWIESRSAWASSRAASESDVKANRAARRFNRATTGIDNFRV